MTALGLGGKPENQTARIYAAELVQEPERVTSAGEVYTFLKGHAYMVRTDANRDLIREIDGGIKKEVSISCAAVSQTCSVCGSDRRKNPCAHRVGQLYGEKRCHVVLSDVTDAYEWSFVAVPAQREAGVTKQFGMETDGERRCKQLEQQLQNRNALLNHVENSLRQEIVRLRFLVEGSAVHRNGFLRLCGTGHVQRPPQGIGAGAGGPINGARYIAAQLLIVLRIDRFIDDFLNAAAQRIPFLILLFVRHGIPPVNAFFIIAFLPGKNNREAKKPPNMCLAKADAHIWRWMQRRCAAKAFLGMLIGDGSKYEMGVFEH